MNDEKNIREQGRIAQQLAADRRDLFGAVPFSKEVYRSRQDLERIAQPVVAVAGAYSAGKSALINALSGTDKLPVGVTPTTLVPVILRGGDTEACTVYTAEGHRQRAPSEDLSRLITDENSPARYIIIESSAVSSTPWQWLDVPGVNAEISKKPLKSTSRLQIAEVADLCILATSALQPLSLSDLTQLHQLSETFPGDSLRIALTRCDQLSASELASVQDYVRKLLADVLPNRQVKVFAVASVKGTGVRKLREDLAATVFELQKHQLKEALEGWGSTLSDLRALLEMRDLSDVKPETLQRIRNRLDDLLVDESIQLRRQLPGIAEDILRKLGPTLPSPQRHVTSAFREELSGRLYDQLSGIHQRLNRELADALRQDVNKATTLALTDRFSHILDSSPNFFDWQSATKGGVFGAGAAGAAMLMGAAMTPVGWAVAGAALLGGLLGGIMGSSSTIETPDELRNLVATPILQDAEGRLSSATETSRAELSHACDLLQKVVQIFNEPNASSYDLPVIQRVVSMAEIRQKRLDQEFQGFHRRLAEEEMQARLAAAQAQSVPSPQKTMAPAPARKALPDGTKRRSGKTSAKRS